jgi:hypothetical protein
MLEEEERSSAANQEEEPVRDDPRRQAETAEVPAAAESQQGVAPISGSISASSGTEQVVAETTAVSAATDTPKPQG